MDDEWPDVSGMQEIKIQLHNDLILPLRHREKFKRFGVELPNGILFYGPPGCGKTYLARRLAEKIGYGFHEVRLSSIAGPYVHQTAIGIGALFGVAAEKGPTLLFLDEVDSLATDRDSSLVSPHRLEIVNELLKQMDRCHERGILVIGACNALDRVDPALRRPGRFDRQIFIGPPDAAAREDLFRHFLKERPVAKNIDHEELVKRSEGYSNADIEAVVKEAGKMAAIQDAAAIGQRHLRAALDAIPSSLGVLPKRRPKQIGFSALSEK
jgi:transitional endoplasmic reticulum ATPase